MASFERKIMTPLIKDSVEREKMIVNCITGNYDEEFVLELMSAYCIQIIALQNEVLEGNKEMSAIFQLLQEQTSIIAVQDAAIDAANNYINELEVAVKKLNLEILIRKVLEI